MCARLVLKSWEDWSAFLRETPGKIEGAVIERFETRVYSVADFENLVRQYGPGKYRQGADVADRVPLKNMYDLRQKEGLPLEPNKWWKDAEGYAVCTADCLV